MAPRRGTALFRVSTRGAGDVARAFDRAERQLQDKLIEELRRSSVRAIDTLRFFAPKDSGDLADQLQARFFYRAAAPRFTVTSPTEHDGYPYTAVTRFGHRQAIIRPRGRALTVHAPGRQSIARLARSVRGYGYGRGVPHDWVAESVPFIDDELERAGARIGRAVTRDMLPGTRIR